MNINEIDVGNAFVTSAIPLHRAIYCGIICSGKETLPDGKTKVSFKRMNGEEEFSFFSDALGNIQLGNWIPYANIDVAKEMINSVNDAIEKDEFQKSLAEENLASDYRIREKVAENYRTY